MALPWLLCACGSGPDFHIRGQVEAMGTRNLQFVYHSNGAVQQTAASALDGKFQMQGRATEPTLVEIYTSTGTLVGRCIVQGGDEIELKLRLGDPYYMEAQGNAQTSLLAEFMAKNRNALSERRTKEVNDAVAAFVTKHPGRLAAAVALAELYDFRDDASRGQQLLALLRKENNAPEALVGGLDDQLRWFLRTPQEKLRLDTLRVVGEADTLLTLRLRGTTQTFIALGDAPTRRSDSVRTALARLQATHHASELRVAEIGTDADTASWRRSVRELREMSTGPTAEGIERYWTAGGAATPGLEALPLRLLPAFVVADSAGRVLYAGPSLQQALEKVK